MPIPWSQYNLLFHIFRIVSRLSKPKLTFSNFPHCQHIHTYFPHSDYYENRRLQNATSRINTAFFVTKKEITPHWIWYNRVAKKL